MLMVKKNQNDSASGVNDSSSSTADALLSAQAEAKEKASLKEKPQTPAQAQAEIDKNFIEQVFEAKAKAVEAVPMSSYQLPSTLLNRIEKSKITAKNFKFDPSQMIRLKDAPSFLTIALNTEMGFTADKILRIAKTLDPRIVIELEDGDILLDKKRLVDGFTAYLKSQQDKSLLKFSRSSKAGLRRNIQIREIMIVLEDLLEQDDALRETVTENINDAFGDAHKHMKGNDIIAFVQSYCLNAEKRRIREEEEELELQAIEALDADS